MTKADLQKELNEMGVAFSPSMTALELAALLKKAKGGNKDSKSGVKCKSDPMTGLSKLLKKTLFEIAMMMQIVLPKKVTKGEIMLELRENLPRIQNERMTVGKYKDSNIEMMTVVKDDPEYVLWTIQANPTALQFRLSLIHI